MKIILFALTSPLVGKISQSFHLDPFLAFTSLFWGLHLAYFSDQLSPLLTFKGRLDPMTNSLYVSDIAHQSHSCFSPPFLGVLFISKHFGSYRFTFIWSHSRSNSFFTYTVSILKIYSCYIRRKSFSSKHLSLISAYTIYFVPVYKFISLIP